MHEDDEFTFIPLECENVRWLIYFSVCFANCINTSALLWTSAGFFQVGINSAKHRHLYLFSLLPIHSLTLTPYQLPQHRVLTGIPPARCPLSPVSHQLVVELVDCWLAVLSVGGAPRAKSADSSVYWQLSRTDGHWVGECEWLLVKGLADWGLHQPINQTCLASSAEAFIMNPRGRGESLFVGRLLTTNRLNCKKWNSEGHAHMSGMTSSHQSLSWTPWPSQLLRSTERM